MRFAKPVAPKSVNRTVNDGTPERACLPAYPEWLLAEVAAQYGITPGQLAQILLSNTAITEDCLFLDVFTPSHLIDGARQTDRGTGEWLQAHRADNDYLMFIDNATGQVLVWIYGGGFTLGKTRLSALFVALMEVFGLPQ